ncbi:MAG: SpoIIE family protein phosphatase [Candidatus Aminicenantes bacterium]|nr:SpoIIE family protein phosphatase [Candidatus Aminicenantes bacterium]
MKKKCVFFCIVLLGLSIVLLARGRTIHFKRISIDEGLSQNSVFCMLQDSKGFMWFGTQDGLNKYDGYRFTIYKPDPGNIDSISHNCIFALCEDDSGEIWIGTLGGGLNRFDPKKEKFYRYPVDPNDPGSIRSRFINTIFQDSNGTIWAGTNGGGLSKISREPNSDSPGKIATYRRIRGENNSLSVDTVLSIIEGRSGALWVGTGGGGLDKFDRDTETFTHYRNIANNPSSLSHNVVTELLEDSSGLLWVGTNDGLNLMNRETGEFYRYRNIPGDPTSLSDNIVTAIIEDRSGVIWVGTRTGGINRFNKRSETFTHYRSNPYNPHSLIFDEISSLYEDRSRILWIGTTGMGLNKFDREDKFAHYQADPNNPNSLNDSFIYSICEDHTGILWIGTSEGGLNKFDRKNGIFTYYRNILNDTTSLSNNRVRCLYEDRSHVLWAGTDGGGLNRFDRSTESFISYRNIPGDPASLSHNFIRTIIEDRSGVIWIGTSGGGLNKMDRETGTFTRYISRGSDPDSLSGNNVYIIYEASMEPGILWVGTRNNGLNRFDPLRETFTRYLADPANLHSLSSNQVTGISEDRSGTLWIGTYGGGLNKLIRGEGKTGIEFVHYTEKNGLCNNSVYGILEDPDGNLWLSTNKGISRFDPRTETFKNFTVKDGLQGSEFNGGAYHRSKSGEMFFGGINGFNAFYPFYVKDNPHIPPIVLTGFRIHSKKVEIGCDFPLNQSITWTEELHLSHFQNDISFEFAALDFTIPEKNKYSFKMEGFNKDWIPLESDKRFAYFTNLKPGEYVFRVKGSNNDGVWNEAGTVLKIVITPPFWATWWFRIALLMLAAGLIFLWYKRRLKNVRIKAELRTAHDAQMSIMPQADPEVKNFDISGICVPANEVGGDFFDYIRMNDSTFAIAIGDVSGKAMKSAMTAVMTNGMIFLTTYESSSIKEIMRRINRPLYLKTGKKVFTALCLTLLDTGTRVMTFANAGLNAPLLKSAGRVTHLKGTGNKLPLGVRINSEYMETKQPLQPGDVVLLFTDGITEARNPLKEFYGQSRLKTLLEKMDVSILSARQIKEKIIADVNHFSQGAAQHDDIAVVVVKVL